jgi:hypothetical protein
LFDRKAQLADLLLELFDAEGLRRWITIQGYSAVTHELPGGVASARALACDSVELLVRHNFDMAHFFSRLSASFPRRAEEIATARTSWFATRPSVPDSGAPSADTPTPSPASTGISFSGCASASITGDMIGGDKIVTIHHEPDRTTAHDREMWARADAICSEAQLRALLNRLRTDHSYELRMIRPLDQLVEHWSHESNRYIDTVLEDAVDRLTVALNELRRFSAYDFFVYPERQGHESRQLCLQPQHNIDRGGGLTPESRREYARSSKCLDEHCARVDDAYRGYRRLVKSRLQT